MGKMKPRNTWRGIAPTKRLYTNSTNLHEYQRKRESYELVQIREIRVRPSCAMEGRNFMNWPPQPDLRAGSSRFAFKVQSRTLKDFGRALRGGEGIGLRTRG